jgi:hypothetical protein
MNIRRGLLRLWALCSGAWVGVVGFDAAYYWIPSSNQWADSIRPHLEWAFGVPLAVIVAAVVLVAGIRWVRAGFVSASPVDKRDDLRSAPVSAPSAETTWHLMETYKALITISVEALKTLALVNGGAAVAILTYLGNLVVHTPAGTSAPNMAPALLWYCGGLIAITTAFVIAYVTQLALYNEEIRRRAGDRLPQYHISGVWAGVLLALFAAFAFGMGCLDAAKTLGTVQH